MLSTHTNIGESCNIFQNYVLLCLLITMFTYMYRRLIEDYISKGRREGIATDLKKICIFISMSHKTNIFTNLYVDIYYDRKNICFKILFSKDYLKIDTLLHDYFIHNR